MLLCVVSTLFVTWIWLCREQPPFSQVQRLKVDDARLENEAMLPFEVTLKVQALDRETVSEVARLHNPPPVLKDALAIVCAFLELQSAESGGGTGATSEREGKLGCRDNKGNKYRDWDAVRSMMSVDLRPQLLAIEPHMLAAPAMEERLEEIKGHMGRIDGKEVAHASKTGGILWTWLEALLACGDAWKVRHTVVHHELAKMERRISDIEDQIDEVIRDNSEVSALKYSV